MARTDRTSLSQVTRRLQPAIRHWPLLVVGLAAFIAVFAQRRIGLSLHDEGFVWYGAQRVLHGELPLRDFQAYDPARYYWFAAWMAAFSDDSIFMLRTADAVLAGITVVLATWAVTLHMRDRNAATALAVGTIFTLWMVPNFKIADSFAVILLLCAITRLIERPSLLRYFQLGVCLGIAAMIGINHALYGLIASGLAFAYLSGGPSAPRALGAAMAGGAVGYAPVLLLDALAPGFAAAFADSLVQIFEAGQTNLSLPFPDYLSVVRGPLRGHVSGAVQSLLAALFVAAPIFWLWSVSWLRDARTRTTVGPVLPAGVVLALPYAHYVESRADVVHAAVSILPVLGVALASAICLTGPSRRWLLITFILGASLILTAREHPIYPLLKGDVVEPVALDGRTLMVRSSDAAEIRAARTVASMAGTAPFLAAPYLPGAYALTRHRSPTWEIYMLFPVSPARQQAEIARLRTARLRFALISAERVDDRPDLGLANTHPLLMAELQRRLERSTDVPGAPDMTIRTTAFP